MRGVGVEQVESVYAGRGERTPVMERLKATHRCTRQVLGAFVFTFMLAWILVILIMAGKLPAGLFFM